MLRQAKHDGHSHKHANSAYQSLTYKSSDAEGADAGAEHRAHGWPDCVDNVGAQSGSDAEGADA